VVSERRRQRPEKSTDIFERVAKVRGFSHRQQDRVLPVSQSDDRLRRAIVTAIYSDPALRKLLDGRSADSCHREQRPRDAGGLRAGATGEVIKARVPPERCSAWRSENKVHR
jgi:hypothetical protein